MKRKGNDKAIKLPHLNAMSQQKYADNIKYPNIIALFYSIFILSLINSNFRLQK